MCVTEWPNGFPVGTAQSPGIRRWSASASAGALAKNALFVLMGFPPTPANGERIILAGRWAGPSFGHDFAPGVTLDDAGRSGVHTDIR